MPLVRTPTPVRPAGLATSNQGRAVLPVLITVLLARASKNATNAKVATT